MSRGHTGNISLSGTEGRGLFRITDHLFCTKMTPHGAPGTHQGVCHSLLRYMQFLRYFLLHQRFSVIELHYLPLTGSQHLDVVEHDIDGSNSHEQSRNILCVDTCFFHTRQQIFDQITDFLASISDRARVTDRSVCLRNNGAHTIHIAGWSRSAAPQEDVFHDRVTRIKSVLLY